MTRRRRRQRGVDPGPRPVGEALDEVVAGLSPVSAAPPGAGAPSAAALGTVFSRWDEIVGPAVARHARPLRVEAGTLVVAVDQPPWATQVRALAPEILGRLAERAGDRLDRLVVVVRPDR